MHVRFTQSRGTAVVDDRSEEMLATVSGIFLHPDKGCVEGFFVRTVSGDQFLAVNDIAHWGKMIVVRDADMVSPLEERVRLQALRQEGRTILGQRIVTEGGVTLGRCVDVQFETETFRLEWLFPKRWWKRGRPIPAGAILEVREDAVCVRDLDVPATDAPARALQAAVPVQG